ncbi:MAG: DNA polymerase Y family protein [Acidimicrobiales bacterium]
MSRTVVVWCPDWPLVATGMAGRPSAVLQANRVVACSGPARAEGVRLRQRRREAEAACLGLVFVGDDPGRDVRAFEAVLAAIARFTPEIEVTRPGVCSLPARGPARYFGGEEKFAALLAEAATGATREIGGEHAPDCRVGIADTPFAARLAARESAIVPPGKTAEWLAPLPVSALGMAQLGELLTRLGVTQLGDFAEMDEGVVSGRLGAEGARAHRLARGIDDHALVLGEPPVELSVQKELDEPVDQVETVAFVASGLAQELMSRLAPRGLACTRLLVEAATDHAEEHARWWRTDRPFTARAMVDRVRWQLEGWLTLDSPSMHPVPSAGITFIRLTAGEVAPASGRQLGFFGEPAEAGQLLERAIARVQGLLGHEAIGTASVVGGRSLLAQVRYVPWGEPRPDGRGATQPWPGRLPLPAPAVVYQEPVGVTLRDSKDQPVEVSGRGLSNRAPARLWLGPGREYAVTGWAGPWPSDERWWDRELHRRRARMQVLLEDGSAHVLVLEAGRWVIEASYD